MESEAQSLQNEFIATVNKPLLSICISGKNDNLNGNYVQRLSNTLNSLLEGVEGVEEDRAGMVEVLYLDWGSKNRIRFEMDERVRNSIRWLYAAPEVCAMIPSKFPAAIAYNAVMKRGKGDYVLQWDSDSLSPVGIVDTIFEFCNERVYEDQLNPFVEIPRGRIPYGYARSLAYKEMMGYINFRSFDPHVLVGSDKFGGGTVGTLLPKKMFEEARGFDEKLIYWGWSDVEFHRRLCMKYCPAAGDWFGMCGFHQDHEDPSRPGAHHECNEQINPTVFAPNGEGWGLGDMDLEDV